MRPYDRHTYFKGLSGAGLKGVDFIGIWQQKHLFLFEVKNFRYDSRGLRRKAVDSRLSEPHQIADELIAKAADTIRAINLIARYFSTRFLFRLFYPILSYVKYVAPEWYFWSQANVLCQQPYSYVCWLELEPAHYPMLDVIEKMAVAQVPDGYMQLLFPHPGAKLELPGLHISN